jgi:hypothetical protein
MLWLNEVETFDELKLAEELLEAELLKLLNEEEEDELAELCEKERDEELALTEFE